MLLIMIRSFLSSVMAQKERSSASLTLEFVCRKGMEKIKKKGNKKKGEASKMLDGLA